MPAPLVLVVDDSDTIAVLLDTTLTMAGLHVRLAVDDFDRLTDPHDPLWTNVDVVLTDLMLGGPVSGLDVLRCALSHHPHLRRVALTAAGSPLYDQAVELSHAVLAKPSNFDDILLAITGRRP